MLNDCLVYCRSQVFISNMETKRSKSKGSETRSSKEKVSDKEISSRKIKEKKILVAGLGASAEANGQGLKSLNQEAGFPEKELLELVHELEVHQIELELQNQELRAAQLWGEEAIKRYIDLFDYAPLGYFVLDREGKILTVNLTACKMLGQERANLNKRFLKQFIPVENQASKTFRQHLDNVFQSHEPQTIEISIERKDKSQFLGQLDTVFIKEREEEESCFRVTMRDITLQKEAERIKQAEAQFEDLFRAASESIVLTKESGEIIVTNLACQKMFGYEQTELIGRNIAIVIPEELNEDRSLYALHKNGRKFPVEINRGYYTQGDNKRVVAFINDISARKQEESRMVAAVLEAQEQQRQILAADLHDGINPMLSVAKMNVEALETAISDRDSIAKERRENALSLLEQAMEGVRNLSSVLMPGVLKDFGLVNALEDLCRKISLGGKLSVVFDAHFPLRPAANIEVNLYRIAQELLNNVIRHSEASEAEVQLVKYKKSTLLMVNDNGIGMKTINQNPHSAGLGLPNISGRVKALDGRFHIDFQKGKGTSVTIEIPDKNE